MAGRRTRPVNVEKNKQGFQRVVTGARGIQASPGVPVPYGSGASLQGRVDTLRASSDRAGAWRRHATTVSMFGAAGTFVGGAAAYLNPAVVPPGVPLGAALLFVAGEAVVQVARRRQRVLGEELDRVLADARGSRPGDVAHRPGAGHR